MLIMAQVNLIRKMYFEEGANISEISRMCLAIEKCNFWQSKIQLSVPIILLHQ